MEQLPQNPTDAGDGAISDATDPAGEHTATTSVDSAGEQPVATSEQLSPAAAPEPTVPATAPAPEPVNALTAAAPAHKVGSAPGGGSTEFPDLMRWDVAEYCGLDVTAPLNFGHSAAKLGDSAIAPIVAAARGYRTFNYASRAQAMKEFPLLPSGNTVQGRYFKEALGKSDVLIMPWFILTEVDRAQRERRDAEPTTMQYRPASPRQNNKGKDVKYEFVANQDTCVGMHPSIPRTWIDDAPTALIAEGLLKGDAALSAYLYSVGGFSREDLAYCGPDAREKLTGMLASIPSEKRIVIYTIAGVGNWRKNNEWRATNFKGREVWIGIDGDVESNRLVFNQAKDMWEFIKETHRATPRLLTPKAVAGDGGDMAKIGIDDYLSHIGTWDSLVAMVSDHLPKSPPNDGAQFADTYRISEDLTRLEYCKPETDEFDRIIGGRWETVYTMGGRIAAMGGTRSPSDTELKSGTVDPNAVFDEGSEDCEIEVSWMTEDNTVETHTILAPVKILNYTPDQWDRHGARIPGAILRNPDWPVSKEYGEKWLRAMKIARAEDMRKSTRWDVMGWVPTSTRVPAFIVGDQVLAADDEGEAEVMPGVNDTILAGASKFGVGDLQPWSFTDMDYLAGVRKDIEDTIEAYITSEAWSKRYKASAIVAAGLRPCIPIRPKATILFVGPRRKGKGFSAGALMGFWSRHPNSWNSGSLPGSAKDTPTAMEMAAARSVIWVADDLAPSTSRQQAEREQDGIGMLIRNIFNDASKSRSTATLGARKKYRPRSVFVVTAENDPTVSSVRDRCAVIDIGFGDLAASRNPTDEVEDMYRVNGAPARVAQALVRYLQWKSIASPTGWAGVYEDIAATHKRCLDMAAERMQEYGSREGDVKRHAEIAADLIISLRMLAELANHVGADDTVSLIVDEERGLVTDIVKLVAAGDASSNETNTGKSLMMAISKTLARLGAHVVSLDSPGMAPGSNDGSATSSSLLGWKTQPDGTLVPCGDRIGFVANDTKTGRPLVYFDQQTAFDVAKKHFPTLVPEGSQPRTTWAAVKGEGFVEISACQDGKNYGRKMHAGVVHRGIPIQLDSVLTGMTPEEVNRERTELYQSERMADESIPTDF